MTTLTALLQDYLDDGGLLNLSRHTLRTGRYHCRSFLLWLEKNHDVRTVESLHRDLLQRWQRQLCARFTAHGLPLKPGTINRQIESVRSYVAWMARRGHIPVAMLEGLAFVKEPKLLPRSVLNHAQVREIVGRINTSSPLGWRDRVLLEMLYTTGVRAAELLGLNVADVDFVSGTALVLGKGNKQRVVPIGRTALALLQSYLRAVRPHFLRAGAETALFLDARGHRLPYHTLLRVVHQHTADLGLPVPVTPHTFRRSCATEMIRAGANLYHVKDLLGHESLETLHHYTLLTIEDLKRTHARCHPREQTDTQTGIQRGAC